MKICIAQTLATKGNIQENIQNHLQLIEKAIELQSEVVIFPELSITGYEPSLAKKFATTVDASIFDIFQHIADTNNIIIGAGMPIHTTNGINISMLLFNPHKKRKVHSKHLLHEDEMPYFVSGNKQSLLVIKGIKIAIGICYETLQRKHIINAVDKGAALYIASVAKSEKSVAKAYAHFPKMAKEFNIPILMSNSIGPCSNFLSMGNSAAWNSQGNLLDHLNTKNQGILIYDTISEVITDKLVF